MLKKRLIPIQLLLNGRLVKTQLFDTWRDVGDPIKSSKVYNDQYADELVFLNINRQYRTVDPLLELLEQVSSVCFIPLALGGGINSLEDARRLIQGGADKVVINSASYRNSELISAIADEFGRQAVIVSLDVSREGSFWTLFSDCGRKQEEVGLVAHLHHVVVAGAGEILLNSIDKDGQMDGYDIALLRTAVEAVNIPVIGCGGAGNYEHLREAFLGSGVDALAMGSIFNFSDSNPVRAKAFLLNHNLPFKVV